MKEEVFEELLVSVREGGDLLRESREPITQRQRQILLTEFAEQRKTHHETAYSMACRNESLRLANKKLTHQLAEIQFKHDQAIGGWNAMKDKIALRGAFGSVSVTAGLLLAYDYFFGKKK